mmetsp:Transcript_19972/g.17052  ORF Transcript_19972/g.17052 Transcript_19972/m.17052 type:complete len:149 (+) Transcript_19972:32-478(+)
MLAEISDSNGSPDTVVYQVAIILSLYILKRCTIKGIKILIKRHIEKQGKNMKGKIEKKLKKKLKEVLDDPYDILTSGITDLIPLLIIAYAFFIINPYFMIPLTLIGLYLFALLDKYHIVYFSKPYEVNSSDYGSNYLIPFNFGLAIYI